MFVYRSDWDDEPGGFEEELAMLDDVTDDMRSQDQSQEELGKMVVQ